MATKKRKSKSGARAKAAPAPEPLPPEAPIRSLEVIGVLMMLAAVALCVALWSFDPADHRGARNPVGRVGQQIADALLGAVGVIGYLGGLFSVAVAGATLFGKLRRPSVVSLVSAGLIVTGAAVAAQLVGGEVLGKPPGGLLGMLVGEKLRGFAGPFGTALAAVGGIWLGLMGLANVSPSRFVSVVAGGIGAGLGGLWHHAGDWWAARAAARRRELEIEAAAQAVEAREAVEFAGVPFDDAAIRAAEREERRRAKVSRAAAQAEARALERLARRRGVVEPPELPEEEPEGVPVSAEEVLERLEPELGGEVLEHVDIPGPGAETPVVELPSEPTVDAADVIDALVGTPSSPPPPPSASVPPPEVPAPEVEAEPAVEEAQPEAEAASEPPEAAAAPAAIIDAPSAEPLTADAGPLIHERKRAAVQFEDEPEAPPPPRPKEREKKVYRLPPLNLLDHKGEAPDPVDGFALRERATRLEEKLETYGVKGKVTAIRPGPVVTTYEYQPAPGVKVAKIANLQDDIAMAMEALRVRIVAPIPGRGVVGIELPNEKRENVYLKEIVAHERFKKSKSLLTLALGKDAEGESQVRDLQKMPHLLVAGTTGSGKSVSINTMVLSMLYKATPDQVKFIMVDPKMLELSLYNDIPHLLLPVVVDPKQASLALQWAVDEMERRYQLLSDFKVRDLATFNTKLERLRAQRKADAARDEAIAEHEAAVAAAEAAGEEPPSQGELPFEDEDRSGRMRDPWKDKDVPEALPYIVVLIDEFADLMTVAGRDVETSVQRLAQKARAAGIHVLLATQRPSTDVITGVIKNNFPCRIAFRVASRHDSATIINQPGAEALLGRGDSLMMDTTSPNPARIHGSFVSEEEAERVVEFWKEQGRPVYDETILKPREEEGDGIIDPEDIDEHYDMAIKIVTETKRASISALQRRLRVGYNRAARMIEMMEMQGIVGPASGPKGEREILVQTMDADGPRP